MTDNLIRVSDRLWPVGTWRRATDSRVTVKVADKAFLKELDAFEKRDVPLKPANNYHQGRVLASLAPADRAYRQHVKFPFVLRSVTQALEASKTVADALAVAQFSYDRPFEEVVHATFWNSLSEESRPSHSVTYAGLHEAIEAAIQRITTVEDAREVMRFVNGLQARGGGEDFKRFQDNAIETAWSKVAASFRVPEQMRAFAEELPTDLPKSSFRREQMIDLSWHIQTGR